MLETVTYCSSGEFHSVGQWIHPERVIDSYELIYVTEGSFRISESGKVYPMQKGSFLMLEPGCLHKGVAFAENVSFFWVHFYADTLPAIPKHIAEFESFHLILLLRQLLHFTNTAGSYAEGSDYYVRLILIELLRSKKESGGTAVQRAVDWIRARKNLPIRTTEVAEALQYNADYLNRLFRKEFGQTLKEYIGNVKMDEIRRRLLTTDDSLQTIAAETGFSDYKYFLRFFRQRESVSPTEYRSIYSHTHLNIR